MRKRKYLCLLFVFGEKYLENTIWIILYRINEYFFEDKNCYLASESNPKTSFSNLLSLRELRSCAPWTTSKGMKNVCIGAGHSMAEDVNGKKWAVSIENSFLTGATVDSTPLTTGHAHASRSVIFAVICLKTCVFRFILRLYRMANCSRKKFKRKY